jgi:hypothetical protein
MRGNLFGSLTFRFEKRVAGERSANGIGQRFACATVQIDAGIVVTGKTARSYPSHDGLMRRGDITCGWMFVI